MVCTTIANSIIYTKWEMTPSNKSTCYNLNFIKCCNVSIGICGLLLNLETLKVLKLSIHKVLSWYNWLSFLHTSKTNLYSYEFKLFTFQGWVHGDIYSSYRMEKSILNHIPILIQCCLYLYDHHIYLAVSCPLHSV